MRNLFDMININKNLSIEINTFYLDIVSLSEIIMIFLLCSSDFIFYLFWDLFLENKILIDLEASVLRISKDNLKKISSLKKKDFFNQNFITKKIYAK